MFDEALEPIVFTHVFEEVFLIPSGEHGGGGPTGFDDFGGGEFFLPIGEIGREGGIVERGLERGGVVGAVMEAGPGDLDGDAFV